VNTTKDVSNPNPLKFELESDPGRKPLTMKFCSNCGREVEKRIPAGDNRERFICDHCETVHYVNPRIVAGCLPVLEGRVLLCQRAISPRSGFWTLPAGFLENGETVVAGATRETLEEANARVANLDLYTVFSLPHISQVYLFYRAELADEDFSPGFESTEVRLFEEQDIPWEELAFPVIRETLEHFFTDRPAGVYPVRSRDIIIERDPASFR
jgi:ADP-ribose pyrophosphatase YjhB (NUDIX family)